MVDVLRETMDANAALLLPILDAISGFSLATVTLDAVHTHALGQANRSLCARIVLVPAVVVFQSINLNSSLFALARALYIDAQNC